MRGMRERKREGSEDERRIRVRSEERSVGISGEGVRKRRKESREEESRRDNNCRRGEGVKEREREREVVGEREGKCV